MQKHVTFNPYVQYQLCDLETTSVHAKDNKLIVLSDKESRFKNRKSKGNIKHAVAVNATKLQTSNLLLMNKIKVKHTTTDKTYFNKNIISNKNPIESMEIDRNILDDVEPMDID